MKRFFYFLFFIFVSLTFVNSEDGFTKKYFNNVYGGGRERIIFLDSDSKNNIKILSIFINVELYEDYSKVKITYKIKNNSKETKILFQYPKIETNVKKIYEILNQTEKDEVETKNENFKIDGEYKDLIITSNNNIMDYTIEESNINETLIPYKLGDTKEYSESISKLYKESIESFSHIYSFYSLPLTFSKKELKTITISYTTGNYYNENSVKNYKNIDGIEDPALSYEFFTKDSNKYYVSDKIFSYYLNTNYSQDILVAKSISIKINSHIIDFNYLKISPKSYSKKGISIVWNYKNLNAKPINNINIAISPLNYENIYSSKYLKITPEKKSNGLNYYYEFNKDNDFLLIENADYFDVREIRFLPDIFLNKDSVNQYNKPLEIEISFAKKSDFSDSIKIIKKISQREYFSLINKKNYITIFKNKPVLCKYIKINVLKTSENKKGIIKINDIEILK